MLAELAGLPERNQVFTNEGGVRISVGRGWAGPGLAPGHVSRSRTLHIIRSKEQRNLDALLPPHRRVGGLCKKLQYVSVGLLIYIFKKGTPPSDQGCPGEGMFPLGRNERERTRTDGNQRKPTKANGKRTRTDGLARKWGLHGVVLKAL